MQKEKIGVRGVERWVLILAVLFGLGGGAALAGQLMDQGAPGKAGSWPVKLTASSATGTSALQVQGATGGTSVFVQGQVANGTAIETANYPVLIAGQDASALVRFVTVDALGYLTNGQAGQTYSPAVPTNVAVSTTSAAATGLTAGSCLRISCGSSTAYYRTGSATPTAVTTDNELPSAAVERFCLRSTETAIAFILSSGTGTCRVSTVATSP